MPLSDVQTDVLRVIAANRSPDSYVAGATVLHRADTTPRFSQDLDLFHDVADSVAQSAEEDAATLEKVGYEVSWVLRTPTFYRAVVCRKEKSLKMEWAHDSAFRFFPVQEDAVCGYRLHDVDASVNKVLAMAGRQEIRDFVDVLYIDESALSLGAMAWAGCGKDPGFTPDFLLEQANRHVAFTQLDLDRLSLREPMDLKVLKQRWLSALERARELVSALPPDELGCLYLDAQNRAVNPEPNTAVFSSLERHSGSVRGAWPTVG